MNALDVHALIKYMLALPLMEVQLFSASNANEKM